MKNPRVKAFAEKWLAYFDGPDFDSGRETPDFTSEMPRELGYDGGAALIAAIGKKKAVEVYKSATGLKKYQTEITDMAALGGAIMTKYRAYRMDYILDVDGEWFAAALRRLAELASE